jgi:arylsulfatase A-like enzyme
LWVPFILHHPSFEARARRIPELVESVDLLPTILDLLQIPFSADSFDGHSHADALLGDAAIEAQDLSVVETRYKLVNRSALLQDGWKLIVNYESSGMKEKSEQPAFKLFRYREDRHEKENLVAAQPKRVGAMFRELTRWQQERGARQVEGIMRGEMSDQELEALRSLGYLDEE